MVYTGTMSISINAYRAAIGSFCNRIRDKSVLKMPKYFPGDYFHNRFRNSMTRNERYIQKYPNYFRNRFVDNVVSRNVIAVSIVIHVLAILANDIEMNPGPGTRNISICHSNIQCLRNKMSHVATDLGSKFDVITLSETWLRPEDNDKNFQLDGYQAVHRKDRSIGTVGYGGVLAWVSNSIACKRRSDLEHDEIEAMWLELSPSNNKIFLCVLYRPPTANSSVWDLLQESFDTVQSNYNCKLMIIGDINADFHTRAGKALLNFADSNNLSIHNNEPTRITTDTATVLDQCLSNFPTLVSESQILPPVASSDHCVLAVTCNFKMKMPVAYKRTMWSFDRGNYDAYRNEIKNTDWEQCFCKELFDVVVNSWTEKILMIARKHIPNKIVTVRPRDKPWYNAHLRLLQRQKKRLFNIFRKYRTQENWIRFKDIRSFYNVELKRTKDVYEQKRNDELAKNENRNSKKWWKLIKEATQESGTYECIPPMKMNNEYITNDEAKANLINDDFVSIASVDDNHVDDLPRGRLVEPENAFFELVITEEDVTDQLSNLDTSKAYGPDAISPRLLKEGGQPMARLLHRLFTLSLTKCEFPTSWKSANVIPLYKKGDKDLVSNYRPISLLSSVSKVFEKIVFKYVYNYFKDNYIISDFQSGFLPGRSTTTQLIEVYHKFCKAVDDGKEVRVIFLDIAKAFDKVWHRGLLHKLHKAGIDGKLLDWFSSYLSSRRQKVVVNGQSSNWRPISAGVPQGSVLGPLLFLLYINDLAFEVKYCNIRFFADDTCLFIEVDNRDGTAAKLNEDLEKINRWSQKWLVKFSPEKTKSLIISNKNDRFSNPAIMFNNTLVSEVTCHTYLGLKFSYNLRWNAHIDVICTKARRRLNMMLPLKYKLDRKSLEVMYKSFVRPVMEYGIVVWGGTYDSNIVKLEQINVDALRLITGATARSNIAKLYSETSMNSIMDRRDKAILTMFYKTNHSQVPDYLRELLPSSNQNNLRYTFRNNYQFKLPFARLESFRRSFIPYSIKLWNALTVDGQNKNSLHEFKSYLTVCYDNVPNVLYYYGHRWANVHHARLRMGCSGLNSDLFNNLHVIDSPLCRCGGTYETAHHFLVECPLYQEERLEFKAEIIKIGDFESKTLLYGNENLSYEANCRIFDAVQKYIEVTERFA